MRPTRQTNPRKARCKECRTPLPPGSGHQWESFGTFYLCDTCDSDYHQWVALQPRYEAALQVIQSWCRSNLGNLGMTAYNQADHLLSRCGLEFATKAEALAARLPGIAPDYAAFMAALRSVLPGIA
jgi:hypothetical protein